jgi:nucleolin
MPAAKAAPAKAAATKRKRESSSSSSSSDSDDDKPAPKAAAKDEDTSALKKQKTQDGAVVTANGGASNTIFVGGLSFQAEESDVKDFFSEFGEIRTVRIPVHSDTGRKKGLAFVEFVNPQDAAAAVSKDQAEMMGRYLNVSLSTSTGRGSTAPRSQELSERPAGCKTVFVGNVRAHTDHIVSICIHCRAPCSLLLFCVVCFVSPQLSWQASEDDLRTAFANCGEINNVRIAWDQEQDRSKGFGHVEFGQSQRCMN